MRDSDLTRRLWLLVIFLHAALVIAAVGLASKHARAPDSKTIGTIARRASAIVANLPTILHDPARTMVAIGASNWHFFFEPLILDEELRKLGLETTTYNLATFGLIASPMYGLTSRIEYELHGKKIRTTLIELSPITLSQSWSARRAKIQDAELWPLFASPSAWSKLFFRDPIRASELYLNKHAGSLNWRRLPAFAELPYRERRPEYIKEVFGTVYLGAYGFWMLPEFYEKAAWNPRTRGVDNLNRPAMTDAFETHVRRSHLPEIWPRIVNGAAICHGVDPSFRIDPTSLDYLLNSIRTARRFSREVIVVYPPYAPSLQEIVNRHVNHELLFRRIFEETGVRVTDLRTAIPHTDDDFVDPLHMGNEATRRLLRALAVQMAKSAGTGN